MEHFSEALRINADDADAHYNIGLILGLRGQIKNSITGYREALRLKPDMLEALDNLAWVFATSKNREFRNATEGVRLAWIFT
jgi:tetratricopeptide (TPR) repeat protein